ncbi:lysophospholipase [Meiothermus luteus]|uniref:lysophospholipase n=1 Tax=Meiothermus luteus TaxID=2026184 RepID=UPI001FE9AAD0|nr:lysophospholipase [Meiothermus luteus]
MPRWLFLTACLGLALAQSPRWSGTPSYFPVTGAPTPAGPALDRSYVLSFPAQGTPKGTLILVPGFLGGATSFEALARRLVLAAPGWAVWAWDRRANGLEDRRGFAAPDPWAYYQGYPLPEVPFLRDWGLRVQGLGPEGAPGGPRAGRGPGPTERPGGAGRPLPGGQPGLALRPLPRG